MLKEERHAATALVCSIRLNWRNLTLDLDENDLETYDVSHSSRMRGLAAATTPVKWFD